jgi:hypothetical protein
VKDKLGLKMIMTEALKVAVKPTTSNGFIKAVAVMIGMYINEKVFEIYGFKDGIIKY